MKASKVGNSLNSGYPKCSDNQDGSPVFYGNQHTNFYVGRIKRGMIIHAVLFNINQREGKYEEHHQGPVGG